MHRDHRGALAGEGETADFVEFSLFTGGEFDDNYFALDWLFGFLESLRFFRAWIGEERRPFTVVRDHKVARKPEEKSRRPARSIGARNFAGREALIFAVLQITDDDCAVAFGGRDPVSKPVSVSGD